MAATRIHHLNFIVRDLDEATGRFESLFGLEPFETVDHASRGARVARSKIGDTWLVLVCPYDDNSVPGRFLAERGEGFFLLSVGTDDLGGALEAMAADSVTPIDPQSRSGILDWRVADIEQRYGAILQLTQDD